MKRVWAMLGMLALAVAAGVWLYSGLTPRQDILFIPLDSRPVNTQYARILGEMGNVRVILPPDELLDSYLKPAAADELITWLEANSERADSIIIFANELFNGGLIASRNLASYTGVEQRLERFAEYLRKHKNKKITVLFVLPRQLPSQFTELWAYRDGLTRWGELSDRQLQYELSGEEKAALENELLLLEREIPPAILREYAGIYQAAAQLGQRCKGYN